MTTNPYIQMLDIGRFTSGILDYSRTPKVREPSPGRPAVIYMHGAGGTAAEPTGATGLPAVIQYAKEAVQRDFNFVSTTATQLWNNSTCQSRQSDAIEYARNILGSSNDPVVLIGGSMGACNALGYAADNIADVACVIGIIPCLEIDHIYQNDILGQRANVGAAHGVTYPTPLPAGVDPWDDLATLASIPIQLWYAGDDPVTSGVPTFVSVTGAQANNVGNTGHSNASMAAVDVSAMYDFIEDSF